MIRQKNNSRGFTLIEVIISIAVLSIASVFILQMFVTSAQLNTNARDIDKANTFLATITENFLLAKKPMSFEEDPCFYAPTVKKTDQSLTILCYFDKNWQPIDSLDGAFFSMESIITLDAQGPITRISLSKTDRDVINNALFSIAVKVVHLDVEGQDVILAQTITSNYFHNEEVAK